MERIITDAVTGGKHEGGGELCVEQAESGGGVKSPLVEE